jgi:hypothetical protein
MTDTITPKRDPETKAFLNKNLKPEEASEKSPTDTESAQWLPQLGQVLRAEIKYHLGFDFLTLWPHLDAFAALDGSMRDPGGPGAASDNRALTRAEALAEIEEWHERSATFELSPGHGDYGVWAVDDLED